MAQIAGNMNCSTTIHSNSVQGQNTQVTAPHTKFMQSNILLNDNLSTESRIYRTRFNSLLWAAIYLHSQSLWFNITLCLIMLLYFIAEPYLLFMLLHALTVLNMGRGNMYLILRSVYSS